MYAAVAWSRLTRALRAVSTMDASEWGASGQAGAMSTCDVIDFSPEEAKRTQQMLLKPLGPDDVSYRPGMRACAPAST